MVFIDDDARPREGWLLAVMAPFVDPAVSVVGGPVIGVWPGGHFLSGFLQPYTFIIAFSTLPFLLVRLVFCKIQSEPFWLYVVIGPLLLVDFLSTPAVMARACAPMMRWS